MVTSASERRDLEIYTLYKWVAKASLTNFFYENNFKSSQIKTKYQNTLLKNILDLWKGKQFTGYNNENDFKANFNDNIKWATNTILTICTHL